MQGSHLDSGSHSLVAIYMSKKFFWGPTWLSLPVSIHKRGARPAVFAETAVALVEGGALVDRPFDSTSIVEFIKGVFSGFYRRGCLRCKKGDSISDINRSLRERFSGNSQLRSRARDVRDCTLIQVGLALLGRGGTADVYVHCRRAWSDLP